MSASRLLRTTALLLLGYGPSFVFLPPIRGAESNNKITSVSSRSSADYSRSRFIDGSFQSETYAFGEGGSYRAPINDSTIDNVRFMDMARTLAGPLALQGYLPTKDPGKANLLIMVYWGMTSGTIDPRSDNFSQNRINRVLQATRDTTPVQFVKPEPYGPVSIEGDFIDAKNSVILGYDADLARTSGHEMTALEIEHNDLISDVEHNRYFVVLMAYDFQMMWKHKQHKLLWETRLSIRQERNDFRKMLPAMANYASQYFGQDTKGLVRRPFPEGNVEVGVPESIGVGSGKSDLPSQTTLIADPNTFSARLADNMPDIPELPAELAGHIAAYQKERSDLQNALSAKIETLAPGEETRRAIDTFNVEHSARIAALNQDSEKIRGELAKFANANPHPVAGQSIEALVRQFNDRIKDSELGESLFTHP
jgi:hypothetical protein